MGKEIVYCSVCGERIPSSDFVKGRAVMVFRKHFCRKCMVTITEKAPKGLEQSPATLPSLNSRTQRGPLADTPKGAANNHTAFLVAGVFGAVAIILLLLFIMAKKNG